MPHSIWSGDIAIPQKVRQWPARLRFTFGEVDALFVVAKAFARLRAGATAGFDLICGIRWWAILLWGSASACLAVEAELGTLKELLRILVVMSELRHAGFKLSFRHGNEEGLEEGAGVFPRIENSISVAGAPFPPLL